MNRGSAAALLLAAALLGCQGGDGEAPAPAEGPPATLIGVVRAQAREVLVREPSVGSVEAKSAPTVSAEIAGRVLKVEKDVGDEVARGDLLAVLDAADATNTRQGASAEVKRLQALIENQKRTVERSRQLVAENFISSSALEDAEAQLAVLQAQLSAARAQLASAGDAVGRGRVLSPVDGQVEQRMVAPGDYVTVGKPLFQIATSRDLKIRLPYPEGLADDILPGQEVRLATPTVPDIEVTGTVSEVRPMIEAGNRALEVIVNVENPGGWRPGASVSGAVILARRPGAVTVPETSVVLRPAGQVVYVIEGNRARQRRVETGVRQSGWVEITAGLQAGEPVAADGAGYLTDGAAVKTSPDGTPGKTSPAAETPGARP